MNATVASAWLAMAGYRIRIRISGEARDRLLTATKPSLAGLAGSLGRGV